MSDIIKTTSFTVTAIQTKPVSATNPSNGEVLTWSEVDGYWVGRPTQKGLTTVYFTESGTWTCPEGITSVIVIGCGGGGGGNHGGFSDRGGAGGGALQQTSYMAVIPDTVYTITIGVGGLGGQPYPIFTSGINGSPTTITESSNTLFYAIGAAGGVKGKSGTNFAGDLDDTNGEFPRGAGTGGVRSDYASAGVGNKNFVGGYSGGMAGITYSQPGGAGGGAGPQGSGGNGGDGENDSVIATNGDDAGDNTGAGGGCGGWGGANPGGSGGAGGSGYLYLTF